MQRRLLKSVSASARLPKNLGPKRAIRALRSKVARPASRAKKRPAAGAKVKRAKSVKERINAYGRKYPRRTAAALAAGGAAVIGASVYSGIKKMKKEHRNAKIMRRALTRMDKDLRKRGGRLVRVTRGKKRGLYVQDMKTGATRPLLVRRR